MQFFYPSLLGQLNWLNSFLFLYEIFRAHNLVLIVDKRFKFELDQGNEEKLFTKQIKETLKTKLYWKIVKIIRIYLECTKRVK